jgi:Holliday junction resolvase RusA-like endonuclease
MITLTIPGAPCAKQRARVCRNGHAYTPSATVNYETLIKELFAVENPDHVPWTGPVMATIRAYFPIPKSTPKKLMAQMINESVLHTKKPDRDNIDKIVLDALKGLVYKDDSQVCGGAGVWKYYSPRPRLEIELEEVS